MVEPAEVARAHARMLRDREPAEAGAGRAKPRVTAFTRVGHLKGDGFDGSHGDQASYGSVTHASRFLTGLVTCFATHAAFPRAPAIVVLCDNDQIH